MEVVFGSNINGVIEGKAHLGMWSLSLDERLQVQSWVPSEGELIDTKGDSGCKKRDEDVPELVMKAQNFTLNPRRYFTTLKTWRRECWS